MYKVLVVGPSWLGDMIMCQALFKSLRKQYKTIDVLAPKWCKDILYCMPEVNNIIELPFEHGDLRLKDRYKFAQGLKKYNYDECIVTPNSFKSALIPYWAKIPIRTGWLGESRYFVLNNKQKLNKSKLPLMVQRLVFLAYMKENYKQDNISHIKILNPKLTVKAENIVKTLEKLDLNVTNNKILILAPGAAFGEAKKWPAEYFAQVANNKLNQGWQVWILGSSKDFETAENIVKLTNNQCINLSGKTSLIDTVNIISCGSCIVSNDSGLLHVAAAVKTPIIGIYGSTSPDFTPPLINKAKKVILTVDGLDCRPCFKPKCKYGHYKCLYDLRPEKVEQAIDSLI